MQTQPTWSRKLLWSEEDARRARGQRRGAIAVVASFITIWIGLTLTSYSCHELYVHEHRAVGPTRVDVPSAEPAECHVDEECVLLPALVTCCGACDPAPPYEAVSRDLLDELLRDIDETCSPATRLCEAPSCPAAPPGCEARAVCRSGRCLVRAPQRCMSP